MSQLVLDAGALVAYDKGDAIVRALLAMAGRSGDELVTSAPVVAQAWRDGRRQAMLAKLLPALAIDSPDERKARRAGELLAKTKTSDVVDALVVGLVRTNDRILTSDVKDIKRLLEAAGVQATIIEI
jgi:hypothetical protein